MKVKKLIIVLAPIGILFVVICAVVSLTRPYFPPRPKNTTLEFWICDDVSSVDWNGHDEITGWMGAREFLGKDYHMSTQGGKPNVRVSYLLTAWPVWGDRIFEKCGIGRDEGGDGGKTLEIRGKRRLSARDGGANYQQS